MHKKDKSNSSKKDMTSNSSCNNSSNNSSDSSSTITNSNCVDNVNDNIQNINNIVSCGTNESSDTESTQESSNQNNNTTSGTSSINTQNRVNNTNTNLQNINTIILSGIEGAKAIQSDLSQMESTSSSTNTTNTNTNTGTTPPSTTDTIDKTSTTLQDINNIKSQLARLDLDPRQLAYYENAIAPLLTTLLSLSTISYDLASSTNTLASSPIVCAKHSKLKDTIHLVYDINEDCEDIYKCLRKRIDLLIDLT